MILSNEPGYYLAGRYGIRLENLLLVQGGGAAAASKPFLRFETLTLAPFDKQLLDAGNARCIRAGMVECVSRAGTGGSRSTSGCKSTCLADRMLRSHSL